MPQREPKVFHQINWVDFDGERSKERAPKSCDLDRISPKIKESFFRIFYGFL